MDALTYFNSLKSQGYDDGAALIHTNQYYPEFKLNSVANTENYDDWFYQNFQQIAAECYPDDAGAIFTIASITNNGEFIEVIAHSNPTIGYDPVRYDFSISNGVPSLRRTFTLEPDGTWNPFFSTGNSVPQPAPVILTPTVQSNSVPQQAPVTLTPTVESNSVPQTQTQQFQTPQPQQMMSGQYQQQQYAPQQQQPMMQGQPMQTYGQQGMMQQTATGSKSKIVTFLLGFFFGIFGIHNFYLGKTGLGIVQLLLTILTLGIGTLITWPWSLIESILALASSNFRDGDGMPLSD